MKVKLTPEEKKLKTKLTKIVNQLDQCYTTNLNLDIIHKLTIEANDIAHKLHMLLKTRGQEPKHHAYMIKNRGLSADHPDFYAHYHPLEDLLAYLEDTEANSDPVDQTLNQTFDFIVYSKRWGHTDTYKVTRTQTGWDIRFLAGFGPSDKRGRPALYRNFQQDYIAYPSTLPFKMEILWNAAETQGLTFEQVQEALNELAHWVSQTEKSKPHGGLWG